MGDINAYECDNCKKVILKPKDVYRLPMEGEEWWRPDAAGGPSDGMQNIKNLGFCEMCARDIKNSLKRIAERSQ